MKKDTINIDTLTGSPANAGEELGFAQSKDLSGSLKSIFSGIRHEIGNPVNSIKITASVLKENINKYPREKVLNYIDRVLCEVDRIEDLLKNLKTFSLCDELSLRDVPLPSFMEKSMSGVRRILEEKKISLLYHVEPDLGHIYSDPSALNQVILILVSNAVDAVAETENPQISIDVSRAGHMLRIAITDNGHGVTEDLQEEIFKPFFSTRPRRTGLGLSIVYKILKRMNGTIRVESVINSKTSLIIHIPGDQDDC